MIQAGTRCCQALRNSCAPFLNGVATSYEIILIERSDN